MDNGKKIPEKNFEISGAKIYDFTQFKMKHMIDQLIEIDYEHPDVYVLSTILKLYLKNEIAIKWKGGYPLAMPN